jgi:hypothetical protein
MHYEYYFKHPTPIYFLTSSLYDVTGNPMNLNINLQMILISSGEP